jgi:5,10-methylenetetrahydrofolate reductase
LRTFRRALQGASIPITAELTEAVGGVDDFRRFAGALSGQVDAIQVTSRSTEQRVSPVALSALLKKDGIDPVPGLHCRDGNRIALLSDLLGLRALGVTAVLVEEGACGGADPAASAVVDVGRDELIAMASDLTDEDWTGGAHEFVIGAGVSIPDRSNSILVPLSNMTRAGAHFPQIRPEFDSAALRRYLESLVEHRITSRCSVTVSLDLNEGIGHCAEWMAEAISIPGVSGFHLLTPCDAAMVAAVIAESGIKPARKMK